eukprot:s1283_g26.t2
MSVPSSWLRSVESWQWRCSAPQVLPKSWALEHQVEVLPRNEAGEIVDRKRTPIVGFRNPKFIYSKQCLDNLKFIPGIMIIALWRDPIDWMWSSLSRAYEGFDASHQDFVQAWHALAVDAVKEDGPLHREGGGLSELTMWRLGVPLSARMAQLHETFERLREVFEAQGCV